jgi:peptidoglycan/LPS O-acetylase OafA/YrhL
MNSQLLETPLAEDRRIAYRRDIDGLRAVAVLIVVVYHAFPNVLPGGFIGVDIFFIISGYLISTTLFQSIQSDTFSIFDFYSRRVRRIFPALAVVLTATGAFGWFVLRADEFQQLGKHIAAGVGFVSNFALWNESGYFDSAADAKPLLHLWSLGIEEQFYFFFPIILWTAWKARRGLLKVTVFVAVLSFLWSLYQFTHDSTALFYSPQTRFWEMMIGAILAHQMLASRGGSGFLARPDLKNARANIGAIFLIVGIIMCGRANIYPGPWALFPTIGATLLIAAGETAFVNRRILSTRVMVGIGLISYPLYLWHWPLLSYARIIAGRTPSGIVRTSCLVAAFVLAYITYRFIERPLRALSHQRTVVAFLGVGLLTIGMGGVLIYNQKGFEGRPVDLREVKFEGDLEHDDFHNYIKNHFIQCSSKAVLQQAENFGKIKRCFQSQQDRPVDTVILGDSHAEHLFIGLAESLPQKNVAAYMRNGMAVRSNSGFSIIFDELDADKNVKQVVLSSLWSLRGIPVQDMIETVRSLQKTGKTVFITDDVPDFNFFPVVCKFKGECSESSSIFAERYSSYSQDLKDVVDSVPGLVLIKTSEYLCDSATCTMSGAGKLYYRDANHLSIPGSQFIGAEMVRRNPRLAQ